MLREELKESEDLSKHAEIIRLDDVLHNEIQNLKRQQERDEEMIRELEESKENMNGSGYPPPPSESKIPKASKKSKEVLSEKQEENVQEVEVPFTHKSESSQKLEESEDPQPMGDTEDDYSLVFPDKYHGGENETAEVVQESEGTKGKLFRLYSNDKREILFSNGVRKEIFPDGYSVVYFANEDIKQTFPDGKTVYYFSDAGTVQSTLPDGMKVYRFNNDQIEKHYTDGTKEINFPDGTVKYIYGQEDEESIFPDGTIQRLTPDGLKVVEYPSGQKDTIFPDGSKERVYSSGKVKKMGADKKIESYTNK